MLGLGRRIRGRLERTLREHGVPSSSQRSFGAQEQGRSPPPAWESWLLRCHSDWTCQHSCRGPLPLGSLNLAPPQATRPLPHPLVCVWGDGLGGPSPLPPLPALGKEDSSLVLLRIYKECIEVRSDSGSRPGLGKLNGLF